MINKVTLIGNLGKDPEVRKLENGTAVANFSLATSESYKDKNSGEWITQTEWHKIAAWRQLAERVEKYLKKGSKIYLEGKLKTREYEDKDGNKRYVTEVVANTIKFLDKREDGSNSVPQSSAPPVANENANNGNGEDDSGDLPF